MIHKKKFDNRQDAVEFMDSHVVENILSLQYMAADKNCRTGEVIKKWVVSWDEPDFDELYPTMAIEL